LCLRAEWRLLWFESMQSEENEKVARDRPRCGRWGVALGWVALVLITVGIRMHARRGEASNAPISPEAVRFTLDLDPSVLNPAEPDHRSCLGAGIYLGIGAELAHDEPRASVAEKRETIFAVLAQSRIEERLTSEAETKLKELLRALQQRMPEPGITKAQFTEFLIQR